MDYGALLSRAFHIAWRHRYLWLLALFAGEAGAGGGFSVRTPGTTFGGSSGPGTGQPPPPGSAPRAPDLQPGVDWIAAHAALLLAGTVVLVLVWIVLFVVSCYAVSAVVRAAAALDEGEEVGLGRAWRLGSERVGGVLRLRLALLVLGLVAVLVLVALAGLLVASAFLKVWVGLVLGIYAALCALVLLFAAGLLLPPVLRLATRSIVLERTGARAGLRAAGRLVARRPGPVVVLYAVEIGTGLLLGVAALLVVGLLVVPVISFGLLTHQFFETVVLGVLVGVLAGAVLVVAGAAVAAYVSTLWTLGFRRLAGA